MLMVIASLDYGRVIANSENSQTITSNNFSFYYFKNSFNTSAIITIIFYIKG